MSPLALVYFLVVVVYLFQSLGCSAGFEDRSLSVYSNYKYIQNKTRDIKSG